MEMKRTVFIIPAILLFCLPMAAAGEYADAGQSSASFGVRFGFSSCSTYLTDASFGGMEFEEYTQDTQLGNFILFHMQYEYEKFFLQSGIGLGLNKSAFNVNLAEHDAQSDEPETLGISYEMTSMIVPLQLGYSIVNQSPYRMSLYAGPSMRILSTERYKCKVTEGDGYSIDETPRRFLFGGTLGFCVQTGRTFFNMEYEVAITDISKNLSFTGISEGTPSLTLGRRMGIFSFSYGILF